MPKEPTGRQHSPETRTLRKSWDDEFENISSNTQGKPRRPDFMEERIRQDEERRRAAAAGRSRSPSSSAPRRPNRPPAGRIQELPRWDTPPERRRTSQPQPRANPPPTERRQARRRARKKMSAGARKMLAVVTISVMVLITLLLAIFMLFQVTEITVTGDEIAGVTREEIIAISGCETGDNLVFLPTGTYVRNLEEQIPYVRSAKLVRHFPNKIEIVLTSAQVAACVSGDSGWLYVNEDGKILEMRDAPQSGVMQILGLSPTVTEPGKNVSVEDEATQRAYQEILTALTEVRGDTEGAYGGLNRDGFTLLDLSDLTAIKMYYEDRVEFLLGNTLELDYKVKAGCRFLLEMTTRETGVMDLTTAGETKRAYFTPGTVTVPIAQGAGTDSVADESSAAAQATPTPAPSQSPREEGIPTSPYTGNNG